MKGKEEGWGKEVYEVYGRKEWGKGGTRMWETDW